MSALAGGTASSQVPDVRQLANAYRRHNRVRTEEAWVRHKVRGSARSRRAAAVFANSVLTTFSRILRASSRVHPARPTRPGLQRRSLAILTERSRRMVHRDGLIRWSAGPGSR